MPIYAYKCDACGHRKDVLQKISDPLLTVCPACGESAFVKQVTAAGFQLKGSGWYVTDFRDGGGKKADAAADGASGDKASDKPVEKSAEKSAEKSTDKTGSDSAAGEKGADKTSAPAPAPAAAPAPAPSGPSA